MHLVMISNVKKMIKKIQRETSENIICENQFLNFSNGNCKSIKEKENNISEQ